MFGMFRRKPIPHPVVPGLYSSLPTRPLDTSGANKDAFVYNLQDPVYFIEGTGYVAGRMMINQLPVVFANQAIPAVSLGGTVTGQLLGQGLTNKARS